MFHQRPVMLNHRYCTFTVFEADEERAILDCPPQDLAELHAQFQHLSSSAPQSSASRLRDFMNQADEKKKKERKG
eukprot:44564-Pelagomonas_calceolata.AAC.1